MKILITFLVLTTTLCMGQAPDAPAYDWNYVIKFARKNGVTKGTREIISGITKQYEGEREQMELIRLYREAYDYKIVDKPMLKHLADSLAQNGLNDAVKSYATESIQLVEYKLLNKELQDFAFPDRNGKTIELSSLREKIVIVELWASWCGPCIKEMPKIPQLRKSNPNVEFYSISVDSAMADMKKFLRKHPYDWPIVFGGDKKANKAMWNYLNIEAIPKNYTVNREGVVIDVADKLDEKFIESLK